MIPTRSSLQAKLDAARKELLDLGLRNPMLNYRPSRARGVVLVDELPGEVYRRLVVDGKAYSFLAAEDERGDARLQTALPPAELQRVLLNTYYAARTFIEEQGANVLYLALGMLEWQEPDKPDVRRAPLVLVPVELSRTSAQARFHLRWSGEDLGENLSLAARLQADFGLELPPLPSAEDLDLAAYFEAVAALAAERGWRLDDQAVALGFFAFGKFFMYRDLDAEQWPDDLHPDRHPVLAALLETGFREPPAALGEDDHLDEKLPPDVPASVVDLDGSQALAVLGVRAGRNVVIQGPPGTGKSQTITNIVADAIAQGRTVLFVAEKMAALEVVKRRLDAVGLGDACLELHSHKTSKRAVLAELLRTCGLGRPRLPAAAADDADLHAELRERLNAYAAAANEPVGESGVTPHEAVGELLALWREAAEARLPDAAVPADLPSWPGAAYKRRAALLTELVARLADTGPIVRHPYRGARLTELAPGRDVEVREAVKAAREATTRLSAAVAPLANRLGMTPPNTRDATMQVVLAADRAGRGPDLTGVRVGDRGWVARQVRLKALLEAGARLADLMRAWGDAVVTEAWDQDFAGIRAAIAAHGERFFRFFNGEWRRANHTLRGICREAPPATHAQRLALLDALAEGRRHRALIRSEGSLAEALFEGPWAAEGSDWDALTRIFDWVRDLHEEVDAGRLPAGLLAFLDANPRGLPDAAELPPAAEALDAFDAAWARLIARLDWAPPAGEPALGQQGFADLEARLDRWFLAPEALQGLASFNRMAAQLEAEGLGALARHVASAEGAALTPRLPAAFARAWHETLLDRAMRERPALASFDGAGHDIQRDRFRTLDQLVLEHTRARLAGAHWEGLPRGEGGGQWAVLRREMEKKSRHLPIRQLIAKAGHAVQAIKPVFMMSPLSIATFLPPGSLVFDLVVFDEASQVKPVDAFGAIMRGAQVVVVGDKRQMPPTSFFDTLTGPEAAEDEDAVTADFESVLGLFEAQGAPQHMLRWHYRSRHESLIAVSNSEFYENRLVIFPSPDADREEAGLRFHHLPAAIYDRGGTRTNAGEARAVAGAVLAHARTRPDLSLGVAAFSVAQAAAIQAEVEQARRAHPEAEAFFAGGHPHEPFFVKNLETVQGDERDVMLVSVGYGRDADGKVAMNFGPLNQDGGERRLNVLITRARLRCEVFSSIRGDDIRSGPDAPRGVAALQRFLTYAETGRLEGPAGAERRTARPDAFADEVAAALTRAGWEVTREVGVDGGMIDVAVRDPQRPGRYLLGVVCDGEAYGGARTARDRDRLRGQVLGSLGWRLYHAWCIDWLRRPDHERQRLVAATEEAARAANLADEAEPVMPDAPADPGPPVEREAAIYDAPRQAPIPPYRVAEPHVRLDHRELQDVSVNVVAGWIAEVVAVEGPVHLAEVARRIAAAGGVKRPGPRFRAALDDAVGFAGRQGIERRGEFLWATGMAAPPLRDRSGLPPASKKLEWVSPEELDGAIVRAVADALGLLPAHAATQGLKLLGFARPGDPARARAEAAVEGLIVAGRLARRGELVVPGEDKDD